MLFAAAVLCAARRAPVAFFVRHSSTATPLEPIVLRPYQQICIDSCLDTLAAGHTRIGVSLPTGSGKTTVFIALLSRLRNEDSVRTKALVVVNTIENALQVAAQARRLFPHWTVEIERGRQHIATGQADLTIGTYQSLCRGTRLDKYNPAEMKAIIVDEAHHSTTNSYHKVLSHFDEHLGVRHNRPPSPVPIFGFTATFSRQDGRALGSVFDKIAYHRDFLDMVKERWLCDLRFTSVPAKLNLRKAMSNNQTGDFNTSDLAKVVNTSSINTIVLQTWQQRAANRKSTLIFCVNVAHVLELTRFFCEAGIDARSLHSGTPMGERTEILDGFRAQRFPVLINCAILTEGADVPNIDCVLVARPTRSRNLFTQMIGRGMRLSPATGKTDCHLIDFVDSAARLEDVVTTPTLFGLAPGGEVVENITLEELEHKAEASRLKRQEQQQDRAQKLEERQRLVKQKLREVKRMRSAGATARNPPHTDAPRFKVITDQVVTYKTPARDTSGCLHIHQMSRFAWVCVGADTYVLECLGKRFIKIKPWDDSTDVKNTDEKSIYAAQFIDSEAQISYTIIVAASLQDAVRGADSYVYKVFYDGARSESIMDHSAPWRKNPASRNQEAYIAQRWGMDAAALLIAPTSEAKAQNAGDLKLTRGEAANLISRLRHRQASLVRRWSAFSGTDPRS